MKSITQHLGAIIAVIAGICLLVCSLTVWRAPIGDFFQNVADKEIDAGDNILSGIETLDLTPSLGGGSANEGIVVSGVVPEGATYYVAATDTTLTEGEAFPTESAEGDIYTQGDYEYCYGYSWDQDCASWDCGCFEGTDGWGVHVLDTSKTSYDEMVSTINGSDVTSATGAFMYCYELTTAPAIPSGVTEMEYTFLECIALETAPAIPSSVTDMDGTFALCESLSSAPAIPNSVTSMVSAFSACTSLTAAPAIPSSVTDMDGTFSGCTELTTAPAISNGVTNMNNAFSDCTSLTAAPAIPSSVTDMDGTFSGCTKLTVAPTIPTGVTNINNAFSGCASLPVAPAIPNSVTSMVNTFSGCTKLTAAPTIPTGVTSIVNAFSGCTSLTAAPAIPSSVTDMSNAFKGCSALSVAPDMSNATALTSISSAFQNCTSLETAPVIPVAVTSMSNAFNGCSSLSGVVCFVGQPSGDHTTYYTSCFKGTTKNITLVSMSYDSNARSLSLLSSIANNGTSGNVVAASAPVEGDTVEFGDYKYTYTTDGWHVGVLSTQKTNYGKIPYYINGETVTNMNSTFEGCTSLTTAPAIPSSITTMKRVFYGCTALKDASAFLVQGDAVDEAFYGCTSLTGTITVNWQKVTEAGLQLFVTCENCFGNTVKPIHLIAAPDSNSDLGTLAATATNSNVTY